MVQANAGPETMNAFVRWSGIDIEGLAKDGLDAVLTEVDVCGQVVREIGIDQTGHVVYRWPSPSMPRRFGRGLFDGVIVDLGRNGPQMSRDEFETFWIDEEAKGPRSI